MNDLRELLAILYRILSKPITVQLWVIAILFFAALCLIGLGHGWISWFAIGLFGAALVVVVMLGKGEG